MKTVNMQSETQPGSNSEDGPGSIIKAVAKAVCFTRGKILLTIILFAAHSLCAQVYFNWALNPSDVSAWEQNATSVISDKAGNVYITGYYAGTVDFDPGSGIANLTSVGSNDIFIAKYNSAGQYVFAISMGGASGESGSFITLDTAGNIYICGYFNGTVDFNPGAGTAYLTCSGGSDVFIAKYDNNGNYIYAKSFPGANIDYGASLITDAAGNVYVTGYFWGTVDFDPGSGTAYLNSSGRTDIFIAKYDASGNYVIAKKVGGSGDDSGLSISLDNNGNIYVTGYFQNTVDFDPGPATINLTSAGSMDIFIAKYDPSLNLSYAVRLGGTGTDISTSIIADSAGNVTLCGYFNGTADFDPGAGIYDLVSAGAEDIFYARYDQSGNLKFAHSIGSSLADGANSMAIDSKGNGYIAGYFSGTADFNPGAGTASLTSAGSTDIFIFMFDTSGNYVYAKSMGGLSEEKANGIAISNAGRLYTTGYFNGTADFDPGIGVAELTANSSDIFIAAFVSPEIIVSGNAINISSGDLTPSIIDNTDLGKVCPSSPTTQTFSIHNIGSAILNITSVSFGGSGASHFTAVNVPSSVQPGDSEDFGVVFTPSGGGFQTSVITINNDAPGASAFHFAIQADTADTIPPSIICLTDIIADNDSGLCGAYVNYTFPVVTDNCFDVISTAQTFNYTGTEQVWTVPDGVYEVNIEAYGAQGGNGSYHGVIGYGGMGGYSEGKLAVTPGQTLYVYVGQQGQINTGANRLTAFNGGGAGYGGNNGERGSGGGASDVRTGGNTFYDRVIVAGGGGGAVSYDGGAGGGLTGGACTNNPNCGGGGTQTTGGYSGWYPGTFGLGGSNIASSNTVCGGGGGYYGGGVGNSGGGGSGYIGGVYTGTTTQGVNFGHGKVVLSWTVNYTEQTSGLPSGSFFPKGKTTNTFLTKDPSGNTATCSFDVIVNDNEQPILSCPSNAVFSSDTGLCTYTIINPEKTVNKTYYIEQANLINFFECEPGSFVNYYDNVGFQWTDNESGTATSVQLRFSVGVECNSGVFHNTLFNGVNESPFQTPYWCNCAGSSTPNNIVSMNLTPQNYIAGGTNQFLILNSMHDLWGLIQDASLSNFFAIIDVTYQQDVELNPVYTDNCGIQSVTYTLSGATTGSGSGSIDGETLNAGLTNVLWEIEDESGNTSSCSMTITINDTESPVITCAGTQTRGNDPGKCTFTSSVPEFDPIMVSDNCSAITLTNNFNQSSSIAGAVFPIGSTIVQWIISDTSGNSNTCNTEVIINDNEDPSISCTNDQTVNPAGGSCNYQVSGNEFDPTLWSDNCSGAVISYSLSGATNGSGNSLTGQYFNKGITNIIWTVTDLGGKTATCNFNVNVIDNSVPVPDLALLPDVSGECSASVTVTPTATDLCQGTITATTSDPLTYNTQGTHTVNWNYDDGEGNIFTQTQKVIVKDITPPNTLPLPDLKSECIINATAPQANDNCSGVITATTSDPLTYNTQGSYVINWLFDDGNGNSVNITQNIIIDDTTKPLITVLPDLYDECIINATAPQANDNCSGVITATTSDPLIYNTQGSYVINWLFDDGNGNAVTLPQNVTIADTTAPVPTLSSLPDITDICEISALTSPTADDNCTSYVGITSDATLPVNTPGLTTITWTFDDNNGNLSYLTQNIIITGIDVSTTASNDSISANFAGGSYQWVDCGNAYNHIYGATGQTFVPLSAGSYAVIITAGNCADTSDCIDITTKIRADISTEENYFKVYPNPNDGSFIISTNIAGQYNIVNEYGSSVMQLYINEDMNNTMQVNNLSPGLYVIYGLNNNTVVKRKIIVIK